ncbi:50S ribosomal protein L30 [Candidatus Woesearchaeota archaeon CG10_big_fil_rev_8_21_14_0_10_30_7]|nr:MAG: 50S ribosomal protein L30 [Candidatus Woesearchaeota archaeon CG10_big_fil_rev_8_21_14_0_10_30_7]
MKLAIIRIRGQSNLIRGIRDTLDFLKIKAKNNCVIRESTPTLLGMLKKVQHLITWGEVNSDVEKKLKEKEKNGVIRLAPPRKGYGRKGVKIPFTQKGAYGDRKEKINDLIERMI